MQHTATHANTQESSFLAGWEAWVLNPKTLLSPFIILPRWLLYPPSPFFLRLPLQIFFDVFSTHCNTLQHAGSVGEIRLWGKSAANYDWVSSRSACWQHGGAGRALWRLWGSWLPFARLSYSFYWFFTNTHTQIYTHTKYTYMQHDAYIHPICVYISI